MRKGNLRSQHKSIQIAVLSPCQDSAYLARHDERRHEDVPSHLLALDLAIFVVERHQAWHYSYTGVLPLLDLELKS